MTNIELLSFFASIASLVLAVIAIWLSIAFFKMSSELSEKSTEAAKGINASVEKLEKLFDKLYTDIFSMMRDTVSDMRKHIWPEETAADDKITEEIEKRADEKITVMKDEMETEVSKILQRQKVTDDKLSTITNEMGKLLDRAIIGSRKVEVEAREETIRDVLLGFIINQSRRTSGRVVADRIVEPLREKFPVQRIIEELEKMKNDGIISFSDEIIGPETVIRYPSRKTA